MTPLLKKIHDRCIEEGLCWLWQMSMSGRDAGRPCISLDGRREYVRRISYRETHGPDSLKPKMVVAATCGNPRCVAPGCLVQVTIKKSKQMAAARGAFSNPAKIRKGTLTKRAQSWITDELVEQIKLARTAKDGSELTGVSLSHAKAIRNGTARQAYSNPFAGLLA